jgi:hypothetical protein
MIENDKVDCIDTLSFGLHRTAVWRKKMACVLIILDTVTRTFGPGDQHQSRDMSKYIQSVDTLSRATGAHVAAIHHSPWSDDRGKGAIDLDGAVDVSFVVKVQGTGLAKTFTLACTGSNDGEDGPIMSFRLESVALGTDADGKITTAPVVIKVDSSADDGSTMKTQTAKALESLEQAIEEHGQRVPDKSSGFPDDTVAVPPDTWRDCYYVDCRAREPKVADDTLSKRYRRAVRELIESKKVGRTGEWNWKKGLKQDERGFSMWQSQIDARQIPAPLSGIATSQKMASVDGIIRAVLAALPVIKLPDASNDNWKAGEAV